MTSNGREPTLRATLWFAQKWEPCYITISLSLLHLRRKGQGSLNKVIWLLYGLKLLRKICAKKVSVTGDPPLDDLRFRHKKNWPKHIHRKLYNTIGGNDDSFKRVSFFIVYAHTTEGNILSGTLCSMKYNIEYRVPWRTVLREKYSAFLIACPCELHNQHLQGHEHTVEGKTQAA